MLRLDLREYNQIRQVKINRHFTRYADGSVHIQMGDTIVICTAFVEERVPPFLKSQGKGWVTAEYGMLPSSTQERKQRELNRGKPEGRTMEIQRLIGRSLRAAIDLTKLGERTVWIDCDVLQADGGTRTTSITGAYVALCDAVDTLLSKKIIEENPIKTQIAAISVGIVEGIPLLDLCYQEDSNADVDMNFVMDNNLNIVEIQGTGEGRNFSKAELDDLYTLAEAGIEQILKIQCDVRNMD